MKIKKFDRYIYNKNPLSEVLVQFKFPRLLEIERQLPVEIQKKFLQDYPILEVQEQAVTVSISAGDVVEHPAQKAQVVYHFISKDRLLRVSLAPNSLTFTTNDYEKWDYFLPPFLEAFKVVKQTYNIKMINRIGLRYRDVIEKEKLGLKNVDWAELIQPTVIGVPACECISDSGKIPETDIVNSQSYHQVKLDVGSLIFQSGFTQVSKDLEPGFFIDSDFFVEEDLEIDDKATKGYLEKLHEYAGSVFRSCIKDKLHDALEPEKG